MSCCLKFYIKLMSLVTSCDTVTLSDIHVFNKSQASHFNFDPGPSRFVHFIIFHVRPTSPHRIYDFRNAHMNPKVLGHSPLRLFFHYSNFRPHHQKAAKPLVNFLAAFILSAPTPRHFFIYPLAALAAFGAFLSFTSSVIFAVP